MNSDSKFPQKIIVAAMGLPVRQDRKYLLTRRHEPGIVAWHNKWQVCGGGLEFGETLEQAMARELEEELGVSARILHPQPIVKTSIWYANETDKVQDAHIVLIAYLVDIKNQKINISKDDETNKFGWFTSAKILKLDSLPMTSEIIMEAEKMIEKFAILQKINKSA